MFWQQHIALYSRTYPNGAQFPMPSFGDTLIGATMKNGNQKSESQALNSRMRYHTCNILNQTVSFPLVPHFIIAGAQKSGTTAFMEFLNEHPDIEASLTTETHFFDWYVPSDVQMQKWLTARGWKDPLPPEDMICALQQEYVANFNVTTPSTTTTTTNATTTTAPNDKRNKLYFEKTPSYLFLTRVPELISSICFWQPKIIVILRNPIDRAFSHFRMGVRTRGRSFEQLIDEEVQHLRQIGLSRAPLRTDNYTSSDPRFAIPSWSKEELEDLHWKHYRKLFSNNYLQRGMYVTQLNHWLRYFPLAHGAHENYKNGSLLVLNYEEFKKQPERVFSKLLKFIGAAPFVPAEGFGTLYNYHEDRQSHMLPKTRRYLSALFRPYNELLADILGEEWRGVWD